MISRPLVVIGFGSLATMGGSTAARPRNASSRRRSRDAASARGRVAVRAAPGLFPIAWRTLRVLGFALLALLFLSVLERLVYSGRIVSGVRVDGVSVAGQGERSAFAEIEALARELETSPLEARADATELSADPSAFDLQVDEVATLRAARRAGRSRNPMEQMAGTVLRRIRTDRVPLSVSYDERALEGVLDGWISETSAGVGEGGLRFEGTTVVAVEPKSGVGIRRDEAREMLDHLLRSSKRRTLVLPVGRIEPQVDAGEVQRAAAQARDILSGDFEIVADGSSITLTPEQLVTALETEIDGDKLLVEVNPLSLAAALGDEILVVTRPPVEARFEVSSDSTVSVVPAQSGRELDFAKIADEILLVHRRIEVPLVEVEPERDTAWAESLGIKGLVSTFTTQYPAGQSRVTNIHRGADLINNWVVEPGDVFSLNDAIGARTTERGFVEAPVLYGEFTEDVGGGVSQIATTLYNAVFYGGYENVTHKPHSVYISRYPMVVEATVSYPNLDLKFRNDTDAGILVRTGYTESSITVTFYGDTGGRVVTKEGPNILEERAIETEYVDWPLLPVGQEDEIDSGHTGYTAEVFRVIERPGQEPERQRFVWSYRMFPRKVLRGTMEPTTTSTTAATTSTTRGTRPRPTSPETTAPATSTPPPATPTAP